MCLYVDNKLLWGRTLSHCRPQTSLLLQMILFIQGTFFPSTDLNYIPLVLFCDYIFGVSVAMAVMWGLLEHTSTIESTFPCHRKKLSEPVSSYTLGITWPSQKT